MLEIEARDPVTGAVHVDPDEVGGQRPAGGGERARCGRWSSSDETLDTDDETRLHRESPPLLARRLGPVPNSLPRVAPTSASRRARRR